MVETSKVVESIFSEMDEEKKVPTVEVKTVVEEPRDRKELRRRIAELSQQKKNMTVEIKKVIRSRSMMMVELKQLKAELYKKKE